MEHAECSARLVSLLLYYTMINGIGNLYLGQLMIELSRNSYQPDIIYFDKQKSKAFHKEQMLFPAPDFVVEILSPSTEKNDRGIKFEDYALHGVAEYWIVDPATKSIECICCTKVNTS